MRMRMCDYLPVSESSQSGRDQMARWQTIEQQNNGRRVELSPATDDWMRGDRFGEIVKTTMGSRNMLDPRDSANVYVHVKLDKSAMVRRFHESLISKFIN